MGVQRNVVATLCVSGAAKNRARREEELVSERIKKELRREQTTATPHLVDFPQPKKKQKHKNPTSTTTATANLGILFPQHQRVKIYENQFSTNTCPCVHQPQCEPEQTKQLTIFQSCCFCSPPATFSRFSTQLAPLKSSQLAALDNCVCVCVRDKKKSV